MKVFSYTYRAKARPFREAWHEGLHAERLACCFSGVPVVAIEVAAGARKAQDSDDKTKNNCPAQRHYISRSKYYKLCKFDGCSGERIEVGDFQCDCTRRISLRVEHIGRIDRNYILNSELFDLFSILGCFTENCM